MAVRRPKRRSCRFRVEYGEPSAADYEQPDQVRQFYRSRPDMLQGLQAVTLEEQVVESLLAGARTVELKLSLEDLLKSVSQSAA